MEKLWLKSYPKSVPAEINADEYSSLSDFVEKTCGKYSDRTAFYNMGETLTYAQLDTLSKQVAAYLQQIGVSKGDRVALMMPNLLQYPVILFGALRAGCIVVSVNPLYTEHELTHQMKDAGVNTIFILENFAHTLEKSLAHINIENIIVTEVGDLFPGIKKHLINFVIKRIKKMVPTWSIPKSVRFTHALKIGTKASFHPIAISNNDIAFLQYTGGTTGVPKGAELTHGNMIANIIQIDNWFAEEKKSIDTIITAIPLYHIFALTANCMFFMRRGNINVLITNPRDIPAFVKELSKVDFNVITGVNTLFNALLNNDEFKKLNFKNFKIALSSGMDVQFAVAEKWQDITGTVLLQGYGLTECSPVVTAAPLQAEKFNGSIGLPLPSTQVSIRDGQGNELSEIGDIGELWIKGPQVMKGYWQNPQETDKVLTNDGWLKTGDMARIDRDGYLYLAGRLKEMIIVSGFNVYPGEVEDVISQHPSVIEVGVAGIPCGKSGEMVKAYVVTNDDNLTEQAVIEFCRQQLTNYKIPRKVSFVKQLPKSNVGKVLRLCLKQLD